MKNFILLSLLCIAVTSFAGRTDSTFQRHQISFSVTNAMSQEFFSGPSSRPTLNYSVPQLLWQDGATMRNPGSVTKYLPNYALQLNLDYSLGISKLIRLETGIGYLLEGMTLNNSFLYNEGIHYTQGAYKEYIYLGSFTVPMHIKFTKQMGKGEFTCTLGPDFVLPINTFNKQTNVAYTFDNPIHSTSTHQLYNSQTTAYQSSLGFDLKLGYEKSLNKKLSINVGPVINFSNLIMLDKNLTDYYTSTQYRPYQYYAGLDVAINFAVGKKKL